MLENKPNKKHAKLKQKKEENLVYSPNKKCIYSPGNKERKEKKEKI